MDRMDEKASTSFFQFRLSTALLAIALWAIFLAVWTRPSVTHIDWVQAGMSKHDVLRIVGPPDEIRRGDYDLWYWHGHGDVVVRFDDETVTKVCPDGRWRK
jgi:hypothetical protein